MNISMNSKSVRNIEKCFLCIRDHLNKIPVIFKFMHPEYIIIMERPYCLKRESTLLVLS